jgi:hypothetical protein
VLLDDASRDRETESGATLLARVGRVELLEAPKDRLQLIGRNAPTLIANTADVSSRHTPTVSVEPPFENLMALLNRFVIVCMMRSKSTLSFTCSALLTTRTPAACAMLEMLSMERRTNSLASSQRSCTGTRQLSIRSMSRMSPTSRMRRRQALHWLSNVRLSTLRAARNAFS